MLSKLTEKFGINITIQDRKAQIIIAIGIFAVLICLAYSLARGWSHIQISKKGPAHPESKK